MSMADSWVQFIVFLSGVRNDFFDFLCQYIGYKYQKIGRIERLFDNVKLDGVSRLTLCMIAIESILPEYEFAFLMINMRGAYDQKK